MKEMTRIYYINCDVTVTLLKGTGPMLAELHKKLKRRNTRKHLREPSGVKLM